ncbi:MAG: hypothetical protein WCX46_01530 [Candidatus Paceibacterota bacterium]
MKTIISDTAAFWISFGILFLGIIFSYFLSRRRKIENNKIAFVIPVAITLLQLLFFNYTFVFAFLYVKYGGLSFFPPIILSFVLNVIFTIRGHKDNPGSK